MAPGRAALEVRPQRDPVQAWASTSIWEDSETGRGGKRRGGRNSLHKDVQSVFTKGNGARGCIRAEKQDLQRLRVQILPGMCEGQQRSQRGREAARGSVVRGLENYVRNWLYSE